MKVFGIEGKRDRVKEEQKEGIKEGRKKETRYSPATMYITPVTMTAVTCFWIKEKVPVMAAVRRHIKQTMLQEDAEFCIPVEEKRKKL